MEYLDFLKLTIYIIMSAATLWTFFLVCRNAFRIVSGSRSRLSRPKDFDSKIHANLKPTVLKDTKLESYDMPDGGYLQ